MAVLLLLDLLLAFGNGFLLCVARLVFFFNFLIRSDRLEAKILILVDMLIEVIDIVEVILIGIFAF